MDKILSSLPDDAVTLGFSDTQLIIQASDLDLSTRLSDAKFPPYKKVLPNDLVSEVTFKVKEFLSALKRVCLALGSNSVVRLVFARENIEFHTFDEGIGEGSITIGASYDGEPFEIKLNPDYLLDMLKLVASSELSCLVGGSNKPLLFKEKVDDAVVFRYVLLPIKIDKSDSEDS
jgi:DNA polymerase-3 subunit beta